MSHPLLRVYFDMTAALIIVRSSVGVGKLVIAQCRNSPGPDDQRHEGS